MPKNNHTEAIAMGDPRMEDTTFSSECIAGVAFKCVEVLVMSDEMSCYLVTVDPNPLKDSIHDLLTDKMTARSPRKMFGGENKKSVCRSNTSKVAPHDCAPKGPCEDTGEIHLFLIGSNTSEIHLDDGHTTMTSLGATCNKEVACSVTVRTVDDSGKGNTI